MLLTINEITDDGCAGFSFSCIVCPVEWEIRHSKLSEHFSWGNIVRNQTSGATTVWTHLSPEPIGEVVARKIFGGWMLPLKDPSDEDEVQRVTRMLKILRDAHNEGRKGKESL